MKSTHRLVAVVLACGVCATSAAEGFYFGVAGGQATYDFEPPRLTGPILLPGGSGFNGGAPVPSFNPFVPPRSGWGTNPGPSIPVGGIVGGFAGAQEMFWLPGRDEEATSWNLLAGYRVSKHVALELAYHDFGTLHEFSPSRTIGQITTIEVRSEMESKGATLSLLGELPITDQWSVYLRAGGLFADQDVSRRIAGNAFEESYDSEVFLYGLGTQIDFGAHWTVRLDFQSYDDVGKGNGIGEADVDVLILGVLFRLGSK